MNFRYRNRYAQTKVAKPIQFMGLRCSATNKFLQGQSVVRQERRFSACAISSRNTRGAVSKRLSPGSVLNGGLIAGIKNWFSAVDFDPLQEPEALRARLGCQSLGLILLALIITTRLYSLQNVEFTKWQELAAKQHQTSIQIQGARGDVFDATGRTLATSVEAVSVGIHPRLIKDIEKTSKVLAGELGIAPQELQKRIESNRSFFWLERGLDKEVGKRLEQVTLPGVSAIKEFRRYYPQGTLAAPILGRVSRDGEGQAGIERRFNLELSAKSLNFPVRRDALGRLVTASIAGENTQSAPFMQGLFSIVNATKDALSPESAEASSPDYLFRKEGGDVSLTIDSFVQSILEEEFSKAAKTASAKRVYGMVMDADSGDILGMAQVPRFDPNKFENVSPEDLRNVLIQDSFEPGSTMKPLVAAAALENKVVSPNETMNCESGQYVFGKKIVRDVHPVGVVPFSEALVRSSNICMAKVGVRLGRDRLRRALSDFGFGATTNIELPGEARGILRPTSDWKDIDVATHSYGQGVAVTALQIVQAYAALANGGFLVKPRIVKDEGKEAAKPVISRAVADKVAEILAGVTESEHGTGKQARISGVRVSGKTGTAQKASLNGRGYDTQRILASFIGFVDANAIGVDRRLVMLVAVDEPGVFPRWGGVLAAPVFKHSMERVLSHLLTNEGQRVEHASVLAGSGKAKS